MKYRHKANIVDAFQWWPASGEQCGVQILLLKHDVMSAFVTNSKGIVSVNAGDWIIKDDLGEVYPCNQQVFERLYERAVDEDDRDL